MVDGLWDGGRAVGRRTVQEQAYWRDTETCILYTHSGSTQYNVLTYFNVNIYAKAIQRAQPQYRIMDIGILLRERSCAYKGTYVYKCLAYEHRLCLVSNGSAK